MRRSRRRHRTGTGAAATALLLFLAGCDSETFTADVGGDAPADSQIARVQVNLLGLDFRKDDGTTARRWATDGIVVNAVHPGWADTPGVLAALPVFHRVTERVLRTPEEGADTIVWLAAATEASKVSGEFWLDRRPHAKHVVPGTRETPAERRKFLKSIAAFGRP